MKNLIFLLALLLFFLSCDKDDEPKIVDPPVNETQGTINLQFDTYFEGEPLELLEERINAQDCKFYISKLRFYFSNLEAVKSNGEVVHLSEIEYYSKPDKTEFAYSLPAGEYSSVRFNLGVPIEMNSPANPEFSIAIYDQNHPLSESNGMYWSWMNGYIFFTLEGKFNPDPNFEGELLDGFSFHSGLDTLYKEVPAIEHEFNITSNSEINIPVVINIDKIFSNEPDHINLLNETSFHGMVTMLDVGTRFANASAQCFSNQP